MRNMLVEKVETYQVVLIAAFFALWMCLNSFLCSLCLCPTILTGIAFGFIQFFRLKPIHESQISDHILDLFNIDGENLKKNTIFHRAGADHAPENTLEAVKLAIEVGIPAIEIDLNFSKDGECVVFHGPHVEDTTDGTGIVHQLTFEELQSLNTSAKDANNEKYPVTRIPKLEDVLIECLRSKTVVFLDCKGDSNLTAQALVGLYRKYPELYRLGIVCSFYPQTIYAVRRQDANILTSVTIRNGILERHEDGSPRNKELWKRLVSPFLDRLLTWAHLSLIWYFLGNSFVTLYRGTISPDFKDYWKQLGLRAVAWTVNCPLERQYFSRNLGIPVITDGLIDELYVRKQ